MPFPSLFKASSLSRTWYFKFPLPSLNVRSPSLSLQERIASVSSRWPTYRPSFVSKDGILGFDRAANRWRSMLTLSYLPTDLGSTVICYGSLICVLSVVSRDDDDDDDDLSPSEGYDLFVAILVTRRWRKLPKPSCRVDDPDHVRVLPLGTDGYRVLVVHRNFPHRGQRQRQVYNSRLKTWTVNETRTKNLDLFFCNSAFLDEKLYGVCRYEVGDPHQFWMYDLSENSWTAYI